MSTSQDLINEHFKNDALTVEQLIKKLQKFDPKLKVCFIKQDAMETRFIDTVSSISLDKDDLINYDHDTTDAAKEHPENYHEVVCLTNQKFEISFLEGPEGPVIY